jgi:hypothetical protein
MHSLQLSLALAITSAPMFLAIAQEPEWQQYDETCGAFNLEKDEAGHFFSGRSGEVLYAPGEHNTTGLNFYLQDNGVLTLQPGRDEGSCGFLDAGPSAYDTTAAGTFLADEPPTTRQR